MDTPTSVPELRRLLDAKREAETYRNALNPTATYAEDYWYADAEYAKATRDFRAALTDDTIEALVKVAEAAVNLRHVEQMEGRWDGKFKPQYDMDAALASLTTEEGEGQ